MWYKVKYNLEPIHEYQIIVIEVHKFKKVYNDTEKEEYKTQDKGFSIVLATCESFSSK
jgi:PP-loop superfamily ATP-utilizing enzyme